MMGVIGMAGRWASVGVGTHGGRPVWPLAVPRQVQVIAGVACLGEEPPAVFAPLAHQLTRGADGVGGGGVG